MADLHELLSKIEISHQQPEPLPEFAPNDVKTQWRRRHKFLEPFMKGKEVGRAMNDFVNIFRFFKMFEGIEPQSKIEAIEFFRDTIVRSISPEAWIRHNLIAIFRIGQVHGQWIDSALTVWWGAMSRLPNTVVTVKGAKGPAAGKEQFDLWFCSSMSFNRFGDDDKRPCELATRDPKDPSNIFFGTEKWPELDKGFGELLNEVFKWQNRRRERIVAAAMKSRSFALGFIDVTEDEVDTKKLTFKHDNPVLSKTDLVATCIFIRGCAKTWIERHSENFVSELKLLLFLAKEDWMVKYHIWVRQP